MPVPVNLHFEATTSPSVFTAAAKQKALMDEAAARANALQGTYAGLAAKQKALAAEQSKTIRSVSTHWNGLSTVVADSANKQVAATRRIADAHVAAQKTIRREIATTKKQAETSGILGLGGGERREESGLRRGFTSRLTGIGGWLAGPGFVAGAIGGLAADRIIKQTLAAEVATKLLAQTVRNSGNSWTQYRKQIDTTLNSQEKLSGFGKTELQTVFGQVLLTTNNIKTAYKEMALSEDVARGRGIDLAQASVIVTRAHEGNIGALGRLQIHVQKVTTYEDQLRAAHIKVNDANRAMVAQLQKHAVALDKQATGVKAYAAVEAKYAGDSAAHAKTLSGRWEDLRNTLDDYATTIGTKLIPVGTRFLAWIQRMVEQFKTSKRAQDDVKKVGQDIVGVWNDTVAVIKTVYPLVATMTSWLNKHHTVIKLVLGTWLAWRTAMKIDSLVTNVVADFGKIRGAIEKVLVKIATMGTASTAAAVETGAATAVMDGEIASVGTTADVAATKVARIKTALVGLGALGAIGVEIAISEKYYGGDPLGIQHLMKNWSKNSWSDWLAGPAGHRGIIGQWLFGKGDGNYTVNLTSGSGVALAGATAGGMIPGQGVQIPTTQTTTHQTLGLPGFPAHDWMATPGTKILAPEDGWITRVTGAEPTAPPSQGQGGPWGLSIYYFGKTTGNTYFLTHLMKIGKPGPYKKGDVIGMIGDYPGSKSDHVHVGIHQGKSPIAFAPGGLFLPGDYLSGGGGSVPGQGGGGGGGRGGASQSASQAAAIARAKALETAKRQGARGVGLHLGGNLTAGQRQAAVEIYRIAIGAGLTPSQALQMVAAAYAESRLDPNAKGGGLFQINAAGNPKTWAAFQGFLAQGYDVATANVMAMLPEYLKQFKANPNAAFGVVAGLTERPSATAIAKAGFKSIPAFYSQGLGSLFSLGGGSSTSGGPKGPQGLSAGGVISMQGSINATVTAASQALARAGLTADPKDNAAVKALSKLYLELTKGVKPEQLAKMRVSIQAWAKVLRDEVSKQVREHAALLRQQAAVQRGVVAARASIVKDLTDVGASDWTTFPRKIQKTIEAAIAQLRKLQTAKITSKAGLANLQSQIAETMKTIQDAITEGQRQVQLAHDRGWQTAVTAIDRSFNKHWDEVMADFDKTTSDGLAQIATETAAKIKAATATVSGAFGTFTIGAGGQTPTEKLLADMDKADAEAQRQQALTDANSALDVAMRIGDPVQIAAAKKQVAEAQKAIDRAKLEVQAADERTAADAALQLVVDELQKEGDARASAYADERQRQRTNLDYQRQDAQTALAWQEEDWKTSLDNRTITWQKFIDGLNAYAAANGFANPNVGSGGGAGGPDLTTIPGIIAAGLPGGGGPSAGSNAQGRLFTTNFASGGWSTKPAGTGPADPRDTIMARLRPGEFVLTPEMIASGALGGGVTVQVTVEGNVTTERELSLAIRDHLVQQGRRSGGNVFGGQA